MAAGRASWFARVYRRKHVPGPNQYTWWDYRGGGFAKNKGVRIDHLFATAPLAARSQGAWVNVDSRKGENPSDHAALVGTFSRA